MATVSRVNSDLITRGSFYSTAQLKLFKIVIEAADAVTSDTQAGGSGTAITEGTARKVADELSALLFEIASDGAEMVVVVDGHANDINSIATRAGRILADTPATAVLEGAGVFKEAAGGTTILTVTEPESFASLMT